MKLVKLKQNQFRNIRMPKIDFESNVTIFIGDNGQGKTNIIEAVYLALNGKSFRPGSLDFFIARDKDEAFVELELLNNNLKHLLKIEIKKSGKSFLLNGKRTSGPKLQAQFPIILFSPESLLAIKEGPELRRKLLDELLILQKPTNSQLIADFHKCLKNRNKLLKDHLTEKISHNEFYDVLNSLDRIYLPLAAKLTKERITALKNIENAFCKATHFILNLENQVNINFDYLISSHSAFNYGDKELYYALLNRGKELCDAEVSSGSTLFGPQRHDIQFLFDRVDARYYCSQGQQRALILAFKMAQMMYHYKVHKSYPLLLLDDVLSELDPEKRNRLINYLKEIDAQILLTTTDLEFPLAFGKESVRVFKVSQGEIIQNGE